MLGDLFKFVFTGQIPVGFNPNQTGGQPGTNSGTATPTTEVNGADQAASYQANNRVPVNNSILGLMNQCVQKTKSLFSIYDFVIYMKPADNMEITKYCIIEISDAKKSELYNNLHANGLPVVISTLNNDCKGILAFAKDKSKPFYSEIEIVLPPGSVNSVGYGVRKQ